MSQLVNGSAILVAWLMFFVSSGARSLYFSALSPSSDLTAKPGGQSVASCQS